jgi:TRIAD3 protein (E3 ubiquitin-protein ligase RNF216)
MTNGSPEVGGKKKPAVATGTSSSRKRRYGVIGGGDDDVVFLDAVQAPSGGASFASRSAEQASPFVQILELYGNADTPHIRKLLAENKDNVEAVANIMADNGYPLSKPRYIRRAKSQPAVRTDPLHNYDKPEKFNDDYGYRTEAKAKLQYDFPFIKFSTLHEYFSVNKFSYTLTRCYINDVLSGKKNAIGNENDHSKPAAKESVVALDDMAETTFYQSLKMMKRLQKSLEEMENRGQKEVTVSKYILKRLGQVNCNKKLEKTNVYPTITNEDLADEILHFEDRLKKRQGRIYQTMRRDALNAIAKDEDNARECVICADDVAPENMITCEGGKDTFCYDCVKNYANDKIFSNNSIGVDPVTKKPALGLICCNSVATECRSVFPESVLIKVLPEKTYFHYERLAFVNHCESKGRKGNVVFCSKCWSYFELIPPMEKLFSCVDCGYECCKTCGHENHEPLTCDEAEAKRKRERLAKLKDAARLRIEDAASEALLRYCPICKKPGIRESGCNHITCNPCQMNATTHWCYVCLKQIPGHPNTYSHFCNTAHCQHKSCNKCPLYINSAVEKKQEEQKAREAAAAERARILEEHGPEGPQIDIDVDEITRDPTKEARKTKNSRRRRR